MQKFGYINYYWIQESEKGKSEVDSRLKLQLKKVFNHNFGHCIYICAHVNDLTLGGVIPLEFLQSKKLDSLDLVNLWILSLKIPKLFDLRSFRSILLNAMIFKGKKKFLKKLCLILKRGILWAFPFFFFDI